MRKLVLGMVAAAALAAGEPAQAADLGRIPEYKTPFIPRPVANWTGCYVGGNAGYATSRSHYTVDNFFFVEDYIYHPESFIGGGHLGCQLQVSTSWVLGIEGTYSATDLDDSTFSSFRSPLFGPLSRSFKLDQIATVTGKVGLVWDRWMLYARGGYAAGRITTNVQQPAGVIGFADTTSWEGGFTLGAGIDYLLWPNFIVGVAVDYYALKFDRSTGAPPATLTNIYNAYSETFAVTARASYLFSFGPGPGPVVARY
jgi:outer membrane immunogenic protein